MNKIQQSIVQRITFKLILSESAEFVNVDCDCVSTRSPLYNHLLCDTIKINKHKTFFKIYLFTLFAKVEWKCVLDLSSNTN